LSCPVRDPGHRVSAGRPPSVAVMKTASPQASPAVMFRNVTKVYNGRVTALDRVSFEIPRGATVALLGPNGAGKSTAIDTMLGLRKPTSGDVRVLGMTPAAAAAAGKIGGMVQTGGLPDGAKVSELIALFRQLYHGRRSQADLLRLAWLPHIAERRGETAARRPDPAGALPPRAGRPARPALPRRADGGPGRRGAPQLLAVRADNRR